VSLRNVSLGPSFGSNLACHGGRVELRNVSSAGTAGSNFFNQPVLTIDGCQTVIRDSSFQGASYTAIYLAAGSAPSNTLIKGTDFNGNFVGLETGYPQPSQPLNVRIDTSTFSGNGIAISVDSAAASVISLRTNIFFNNSIDGAPALTTSYK